MPITKESGISVLSDVGHEGFGPGEIRSGTGL